MNLDDVLKTAWQGETRAAAHADLARCVRRHRRRNRTLRALEAVLTLVAVLVFGQALASGTSTPAHWLLLPFYAVFLPVVWTFTLRAPRPFDHDVAENTRLYARLRVSQLRARLRDWWLARAAAWSLLAYAAAANLGVWMLGAPAWRPAGLMLLGAATVWAAGTAWVSRRRCPALRREYRAMRALAGR